MAVAGVGEPDDGADASNDKRLEQTTKRPPPQQKQRLLPPRQRRRQQPNSLIVTGDVAGKASTTSVDLASDVSLLSSAPSFMDWKPSSPAKMSGSMANFPVDFFVDAASNASNTGMHTCKGLVSVMHHSISTWECVCRSFMRLL